MKPKGDHRSSFPNFISITTTSIIIIVIVIIIILTNSVSLTFLVISYSAQLNICRWIVNTNYTGTVLNLTYSRQGEDN
jgi:ABC-type bacteriocin/lantibiotic exporter with double-glycine peptidase domain